MFVWGDDAGYEGIARKDIYGVAGAGWNQSALGDCAAFRLTLKKTWPVRDGQRVRGEIEGFAFRNSLFPDPRGEGHCCW